jgi:predicted enzyme related to lactoylglutathione lyase
MEMMPGFTYTMFANKGREHAGIMPITPEQGDAKPRWDTYISVKDVDAIAQQCEAMGGEIVIPAHDIPVGRWAMLKDPTGATFAIYKSKRK